MLFETWIAFVAASALLFAIPGPVVVMAGGYVLGKGRASLWATIPGVLLGDFVAMSISLAGAGAVLALSATLFTFLKLAGAAYLIWLGIQMWRMNVQGDDMTQMGPDKADFRRMFRNAFLITVLNPKSILFFMAFLPQFIDPDGQVLLQFLILEATFLSLSAFSIGVWGLMADRARHLMKTNAAQAMAGKFSGSVLIGAGVLTAIAREK